MAQSLKHSAIESAPECRDLATLESLPAEIRNMIYELAGAFSTPIVIVSPKKAETETKTKTKTNQAEEGHEAVWTNLCSLHHVNKAIKSELSPIWKKRVLGIPDDVSAVTACVLDFDFECLISFTNSIPSQAKKMLGPSEHGRTRLRQLPLTVELSLSAACAKRLDKQFKNPLYKHSLDPLNVALQHWFTYDHNEAMTTMTSVTPTYVSQVDDATKDPVRDFIDHFSYNGPPREEMAPIVDAFVIHYRRRWPRECLPWEELKQLEYDEIMAENARLDAEDGLEV